MTTEMAVRDSTQADTLALVANSSQRSCGSPASSSGDAPPVAGLYGCIFNLTNTILGAGMLGLPHAFAESGYITGSILLVACASFSAIGLHLLSEAGRSVGRTATFGSVAERAVPGSGVLVDLAILLKCFGVATSYLIVVGDSMPLALEAFMAAPTGGAGNPAQHSDDAGTAAAYFPIAASASGDASAMSPSASALLFERSTWTMGAALLVSPLVFLHRLDALRHASLLALACVAVVTVLIVSMAGEAGPCAAAHAAGHIRTQPAAHSALRAFAAVPPPWTPVAMPWPPHAPPLVPPRSLLPTPPQRPPPPDPALPTDLPCRLGYTATASWAGVGRSVPIFVFAFTCHQNLLSITSEMRQSTTRRVGWVVLASVCISLAEYITVFSYPSPHTTHHHQPRASTQRAHNPAHTVRAHQDLPIAPLFARSCCRNGFSNSHSPPTPPCTPRWLVSVTPPSVTRSPLTCSPPTRALGCSASQGSRSPWSWRSRTLSNRILRSAVSSPSPPAPRAPATPSGTR